MKRFSLILLTLILLSHLHAQETVVLLHGLARSSKSMQQMETALLTEGYQTLNIDYPSRKHKIQYLAAEVRAKVIEGTKDATKVHFVTHSMGGILVRHIQKEHPIETIGRVVMLSPPNQGSEVIDKIGDQKVVMQVNGPAGNQLGTHASSFVRQLGAVDFELGVITGDRSINWINSLMIPGKDDGKVSTESAKVAGMQDYKSVHLTHPMIMNKRSVIEDAICFLKTGSFEGEL